MTDHPAPPDRTPATPPARAARPRRRHRLRNAALVVLALLVLGLAAGGAWLGSEAALQFAVAELAARSGGQIAATEVTGSLLSTVRARGIVYRAEDLVVTAEGVVLTWSPAALWSRALRVERLAAERVGIELRPKKAAAAPPGKLVLPASFALPIDVAITRAVVGRLTIDAGDAAHTVTDIALGYRGGAAAHRFSDIEIVTDFGRLSGEIALATAAPFAVDGTLNLAGSALLRDAMASVTMSGSLAALELKAQARAVGASADASATVVPLSAQPLVRLTLDARALDLAALAPKLPATALTVALKASTRADGRFEGSLAVKNAAAGPIDAARVPVVALATQFVADGAGADLSAFVAELGRAGRVSGSGRLAIAGDGLPGLAGSKCQLTVRDLDLALLRRDLAPTRLNGSVRATLEAAAQRIEVELTERGIALDALADIAGNAIDIRRFRARAKGGELAGRARMQFDGARPFEITVTAAKLDPSRFGAFPKASLDGDIAVTGQLAPAWTAKVKLALAPGARFAGAPIAGTARFALAAQALSDAAVDATLAGARLQASGSFGRAGDRLDFALDVPKLEAVIAVAGSQVPAALRAAAGRLQAKGHLDGEPARPGFGLVARADALRLGAYGIGKLELRAEVAPPGAAAVQNASAMLERAMTIAVTATRLTTPAGKYGAVGTQVSGTLARHQATLTVTGEDIDLETRLAGGLAAPGDGDAAAGWAWSGAVQALENRGAYAIHLDAPASLFVSRDVVRVGEAVLAFAEGRFRVDAFAQEQGRVTTQGSFAGLPLASIARLAGTALPLRSTLTLAGAWNIAAAPRLNGTVAVRRERGDLYAPVPDTPGTGEIAVGIERFEVTARFNNDALSAQAALVTGRFGRAGATLALGAVAAGKPGGIAPDAPLEASVNVDLASLRVLQPWIGTVASVDGRVRLELAATGTRTQAAIAGTLAADALTVNAPQYGVYWSGGTVRARIADDKVTLDEFAFAAGDGRFTVAGTLQAPRLGGATKEAVDAAARLTWRAERFRAFNQPDLRLVVDGQGTIDVDGRKIALTGALKVVEGGIEYVSSPAGRLGSDVIVAGRSKPGDRVAPASAPASGKAVARAPAAAPAAVALTLDLELDTGKNLTVRAQGLDTHLEGRVRLTTAANAALVAKGSIEAVRGIYQAFGQRLVITRGRLIFDGPIDNPALDIVALRRNLAVEAGVEVTGTVRLPHVRLTSEPPVPDNEKLAWLVLGRALDRASGGDVASMQAAAAALFGQGQAPLGSSVAHSVGLDDIAFKGGSTTGGAAGGGVGGGVIAFGKRISDKLYIVYEQGLSVANNALRIEYALTRNFTLRAEAGIISGFGIYYSRSFE